MGGGVYHQTKNLRVPPTLRKSENGKKVKLEKNDNMTHNRGYFPKGQKWNPIP
jgi:hypothetical protein